MDENFGRELSIILFILCIKFIVPFSCRERKRERERERERERKIEKEIEK